MRPDGASDAPADGGTIPTDAPAEVSVQFYLSADAYLDSVESDVSFGSAAVVSVGPEQVGLVRADLRSIAANATVIRAELVVTMTNDALESGMFHAYRLTQSWQESFATWVEADSAAGVSWATEGAGPGSFAPGVVASFAPRTGNALYRVPVSLATVQLWVQNPATNHGLTWVSTGASGAWYSRERSPVPTFEVSYLLP